MPRRTYVFYILALLLSAVPAWTKGIAHAQSLPTNRLEQALKANPVSKAKVGIAVRRLSDGKEFFTRSPRDLFELASNEKLFTTGVALRELGKDYEFKTSLIANGPLENTSLSGDLVIVGGGDPNISGRFHNGDIMAIPKQMAQAVREVGITEITGDLVMDDRLFDRELRAPGWSAKESLWWYSAPVCALSFNDNCLDIRITGGKQVGAPGVVAVTPDVGFGKIANRTSTCATRREEGITFKREKDGTIVVGGKIRPKVARTESITVEHPALYLGTAIRKALTDEGIVVRGTVRRVHDDEQAQPEAREIFAWHSRLADAVAVANRRSQNFVAEQIFKTIGAAKHSVGTFKTGSQTVQGHLVELGFPPGTMLAADGSGLSPGNYATPQAVVAFLEIMYNSPLRETYMGSLAVNGNAATTLRNRLTEAKALGRIHAKTGTIRTRGVTALSGYAQALDGEVYAFSILTNDASGAQFAKARAMEDAVCRALLGVPNR